MARMLIFDTVGIHRIINKNILTFKRIDTYFKMFFIPRIIKKFFD